MHVSRRLGLHEATRPGRRLAALMIPVFLLLAALVVDAGNWYAHKRSLQNRADAGALAAGLEYIGTQLKNCNPDPGASGTTIAKVAKGYAGTNEVGRHDVQQERQQPGERHSRRQRDESHRRGLDGRRRPCATIGGAHTTGDGWSPKGLWTDVKIREANVGTLFGSFGISLPQIAAQARVKVEPIIGVAAERPAFRRRDGRPDRVRLGTVRASAGRLDDGLHSPPSNPIPLTEGPNNTWTGTSPTSSSRTPPTTSRSDTGGAARTARRRATSQMQPEVLCRTRSKRRH